MQSSRSPHQSTSSPMAGRAPAMGRMAWLCCLLMLLASLDGSAGGATITGQISYSNGAPAVSVIVQVAQVWAYTDVRGYFRLNDVPFGEQRLEIRYGDRVLKVTRILVNQAQLVVDQKL